MCHRILIVFSLAVIISLRSLANFARENEMNKFFACGMALIVLLRQYVYCSYRLLIVTHKIFLKKCIYPCISR